ncbi:MAG TPA: DUF4157 domain-containing protein [Rubrivivax sp.]|nr:DUF4157 domain-containing protein [Rubrivivax sp.]HRY86446.1 DUF4157 domain-containing protein [Rubrivivax sp.]
MSDLDLERRVAMLAPPTPAPTVEADRRPATQKLEREPIDRVSCRLGDGSCAQAHAATLDRSPGAAAQGALLRLQRRFGNRYVGEVLARARSGEGDDETEAVERSIDQARGAGQGLDHHTQRQMESAFGANFGSVRIHTDSRADSLNRALSARAFTTGTDVFFRQGEYSPGTSTGRELLAHELTHVVQQTGDGIRRKMTVSQPGDAHEIEADQMARAVIQQEQRLTPGADRQVVHRQEDEKEVETKPADAAIQRQPEAPKSDEEEEKKKKLQTKADREVVARQAEEEEQTE